jgi:hypothetical protein
VFHVLIKVVLAENQIVVKPDFGAADPGFFITAAIVDDELAGSGQIANREVMSFSEGFALAADKLLVKTSYWDHGMAGNDPEKNEK